MRLLRVLLVLFLIPTLAWSAQMSWSPVTTYTDGTAIEDYNLGLLTYQTFTGITSSGPWVSDAVTIAGMTSATVREPPQYGVTQWYTAKAFLNGAESDYGVPVGLMRPFPATKVPSNPGGMDVR